MNTDGYVLACYRYIELNPVRAGMVASPEQYRWSSYAANAHDAPGHFVTAHGAYEALGSANAYKELCRTAPPQDLIDEIRRATSVGRVAGVIPRKRGRPVSAR